ncbi:glycosyltransferase family 2 protein [Microbacterium sp.]|uniref:glycosyltransferase family 2 protein n=1 Tax=Microbacterium sp. TaxID=51671 RepID=UPI0027340BC4|nr:glycosyltransferase family 2 protein [Microbacterium sp.]MDP3949403.1 glycosyltransferase family 2 protein [Microbacterium sp.]
MPADNCATEPEGLLISILSTAYNESEHISEMIDSVLAQSHTNWELLIIDDASTDNTAEIIASYALRSPRIQFVSRGTKLGKVKAFNTAFAASSGGVIVLMGADDVMPPDSLSIRAGALSAQSAAERSVGYFKLKTFSDHRKFDGLVIPRGEAGSRSGPSLTMSRALADLVFPIPEHLVSEDTWLGEATEALAEFQINSPRVVVNYRIHAGNSNPRHKTFEQMDAAMHKRAAAWPALLAESRFVLPERSRRRIESLVRAETHRHAGETFRILTQRSVPLADRLAVASMSAPRLFALRTRFYRFFTGWRGR